LLTLAANTNAAENVRSITLLQIDELKKYLQGALKTATGSTKANVMFGLSQINLFEKTPDKFQPASPLNMPDGSPIGTDDQQDY
jgi:hypothetical protein